MPGILLIIEILGLIGKINLVVMYMIQIRQLSNNIPSSIIKIKNDIMERRFSQFTRYNPLLILYHCNHLFMSRSQDFSLDLRLVHTFYL